MGSRGPVVLVRRRAQGAPLPSAYSDHLAQSGRHTVIRFIGLVLVAAVCSSVSFGQIPNAGFEFWETDPDSNFNPLGWQTTNSFPLVNVERYSPGCQGSYAMKVKTVNLGFPFPGIAILEAAYNFTQAPTSITLCYKATIMPGDRAYIITGLMRGDSIIALPDSCTFKIDSTKTQFTTRTFRLAIQSNLVPDSLIVIIASGIGSGQVGTELVVDELAFGTGAASVPVTGTLPPAFSLHQNYPNPFNPSTTFTFSLPSKTFVSLKVFDPLGREVSTLLSKELPAGTHSTQWNAQGLPSGVYFYRLQTNSFVESKKLVLLK